jgi:hypothetical protein
MTENDLSLGQIFAIALGVVRWTIAIASVLATLALFGWILKMILKKDKRDELN